MNSHLLSTSFAAMLALTLSACSGSGSTTPVSPAPPPSNSAPVVDAGADQSVAEDETVQLSSTVSDADNDTLTYSWSRVSGPYMQFSDSMIEAPSFIAPDVASPQDIVFELSVSDGTETVTDSITVSVSPVPESQLVSTLFNGALTAADYWAEDPMILSAGMGFDNIIAIPEITESAVRDAGGAWFGPVLCTNGEEVTLTTATPQDGTANVIKGHASFDDGIPIVFSWPLALETGLNGQARVTEEGLPGRSTCHDMAFLSHHNGLDALPMLIESHAPLDLLIIMLGTNDMQKHIGSDAYNAARGVQRLIHLARARIFELRQMRHPKLKQPEILIISPPDMVRDNEGILNNFGTNIPAQEDVRAEYSKVAQATASYVFHAGEVVQPSPIDGVHLSAKDTKALGEALVPKVKQILKLD